MNGNKDLILLSNENEDEEEDLVIIKPAAISDLENEEEDRNNRLTFEDGKEELVIDDDDDEEVVADGVEGQDDDGHEDDEDEDGKCENCGEEFDLKSPFKLLPCLHGFCEKCLLDSKGECPTCGSQFFDFNEGEDKEEKESLFSRKVSLLPIDGLKFLSSSVKRRKKCNVCDTECHSNDDSDCSSVVFRRRRRCFCNNNNNNHRNNRENSPFFRFRCSQHPNSLAVYICVTCSSNNDDDDKNKICETCFSTSTIHGLHEVKTLAQRAQDLVRQVDDERIHLLKLTDKEENEDFSNKAFENLQSDVNRAKLLINQTYLKYKSLLDKVRDKLLSDLEAKHNSSVHRQMEWEFERKQKETQHTLEYSRKLANAAAAAAAAASGGDFNKSAEEEEEEEKAVILIQTAEFVRRALNQSKRTEMNVVVLEQGSEFDEDRLYSDISKVFGSIRIKENKLSMKTKEEKEKEEEEESLINCDNNSSSSSSSTNNKKNSNNTDNRVTTTSTTTTTTALNAKDEKNNEINNALLSNNISNIINNSPPLPLPPPPVDEEDELAVSTAEIVASSIDNIFININDSGNPGSELASPEENASSSAGSFRSYSSLDHHHTVRTSSEDVIGLITTTTTPLCNNKTSLGGLMGGTRHASDFSPDSGRHSRASNVLSETEVATLPAAPGGVGAPGPPGPPPPPPSSSTPAAAAVTRLPQQQQVPSLNLGDLYGLDNPSSLLPSGLISSFSDLSVAVVASADDHHHPLNKTSPFMSSPTPNIGFGDVINSTSAAAAAAVVATDFDFATSAFSAVQQQQQQQTRTNNHHHPQTPTADLDMALTNIINLSNVINDEIPADFNGTNNLALANLTALAKIAQPTTPAAVPIPRQQQQSSPLNDYFDNNRSCSSRTYFPPGPRSISPTPSDFSAAAAAAAGGPIDPFSRSISYDPSRMQFDDCWNIRQPQPQIPLMPQQQKVMGAAQQQPPQPLPPQVMENASTMQIRAKFGQLGSAQGMFNSPHGFCLSNDGDIVVADTNNHRIQIFNKNGVVRYAFGIAGKEEGSLWYPRKVAVMKHNGNFVVCDRGGERSRMQIFSPFGHFLQRIHIRFIDIVAGLAITREGHIVAVDSVTPTVFVISEQGKLIHYIECNDFMTEPSDIGVYRDEYYICDFKGHSIVVVREDGTFLRRIGNKDVTRFPNGIDISDQGDVVVGDSHGNQFHVTIYSNDGDLLSEFICPHVKVSRCCGLKITPEGYIVTLAKNNHHVLVLNTLFVS